MSFRAMLACASPAFRSIFVKCLVSFLIYLIRRFQHRIHFHPLALFQTAVETALASGMTGDAAQLFNLQQDHITIAIETYLFHLLDMPGYFAFVPQLLARTRPINRLAFLLGEF